MPHRKMVYDDATILTFNNKDKSSYAAMSMKGEDEEEAKAEYLAQFDLEPLSLEEQKEMTAEAIKEHRDQVEHLKKSK